MLEVLDPAQNSAFEDHYLDVPFDLSRVMFIATANYAGQIPQPLYDRMEVIQIPGYILSEKRAIASRYLVPRQIEAHGLKRRQLRIPYATVREVIEGYTREAGVRELERKIAQICRKVAAKIATGEASPRKIVTIQPDSLPEYLGPRQFDRESDLRTRRPGVVTGLAWTPTGGEVLYIEARRMSGKGNVKVTGQIGQVMNESISIAWSIVRSECARFGIDPKSFTSSDFHVHVPAGAVPKDGPSAGVTMTTALISLLARRGKGIRVSRKLAMTGEITLSGTVLPVGGIREKVVAGKRAGIKTIVLPARNRSDLEEVPERVRKGIRFVFAETLDDVLAEAMPKLTETG
jgi:ATP-dependent Lon protease